MASIENNIKAYVVSIFIVFLIGQILLSILSSQRDYITHPFSYEYTSVLLQSEYITSYFLWIWHFSPMQNMRAHAGTRIHSLSHTNTLKHTKHTHSHTYTTQIHTQIMRVCSLRHKTHTRANIRKTFIHTINTQNTRILTHTIQKTNHTCIFTHKTHIHKQHIYIHKAHAHNSHT